MIADTVIRVPVTQVPHQYSYRLPLHKFHISTVTVSRLFQIPGATAEATRHRDAPVWSKVLKGREFDLRHLLLCDSIKKLPFNRECRAQA